MTLPQETIDKIKADAEKYANLFKHGAGYREPAYADGATEWAGKAQGLVDALQELVNLKHIKEQFGKTDEYLNNQPLAWETAETALAKYKEVNNG